MIRILVASYHGRDDELMAMNELGWERDVDFIQHSSSQHLNQLTKPLVASTLKVASPTCIRCAMNNNRKFSNDKHTALNFVHHDDIDIYYLTSKIVFIFSD